MKIRIVQQISGTRGDRTDWPPAGSELVVGDLEGAELCRSGVAIPVAEETPPVETRRRKTSKAKDDEPAADEPAAAAAPAAELAVPDETPAAGSNEPLTTDAGKPLIRTSQFK